MTKSALQRRLNQALEADNSIVIDPKDLSEAKGFNQDYLLSLGLRKADLVKLETMGQAKRTVAHFRVGLRYRFSHLVWILLANEQEVSKPFIDDMIRERLKGTLLMRTTSQEGEPKACKCYCHAPEPRGWKATVCCPDCGSSLTSDVGD